MRTIGVVTCARSDLGAYVPLWRAIEAHPGLELAVIATGMHLAPEFGLTVRQIEETGIRVAERVESLVAGDTPDTIGAAMARGLAGFSTLFTRWRPDLLVVLGDRFDMYPAALAALPFCIPVAHIGGGERTEGAIDDALRHSLTKLSHLHFVATPDDAERVLQMGEEPWRVVVSGAPGLDRIRQMALWSREHTAQRFDVDPARPVALVTFHPVTLELDHTPMAIEQLLSALAASGLQCLFTAPNADPGWAAIRSAIEQFCRQRPQAHLVDNCGDEGYVNLLNTVTVMVGNSSSGLIEAPSFRLPVVNIGDRQAGRLRTGNVIDCPAEASAILAALARALAPTFRASLQGLENPYGDGHAAERIVERLSNLPSPAVLVRKRFAERSAARTLVGVG